MDPHKMRPVEIKMARYRGPNTETLKSGTLGLFGKVPVNNPNIRPSWVFWPNRNGCEKANFENAMMALDESQFEDVGMPSNADFLDYFGSALSRNTSDLNRLAVFQTPIGQFDPNFKQCFIHAKYEASRIVDGSRIRYTFTRYWTNWGWAE